MRLGEWRVWVTGRGQALSQGTAQSYGNRIGQFLEEFPDPRKAKPADITRWLVKRGGSPSSYNGRHAALVSYFRFLVEVGELPGDPMSGVPRMPTRPFAPRPVPDAESKIAATPGDPRYMWAAVLCHAAGLKISEAFLWEVDGDYLVIAGRMARRVPLTPRAKEAIGHLGGRMPSGPGWTKRTMQRRFRDAGFNVEALRQTLGDRFARQGEDVGTIQAGLGYRNPATARAYMKKPIPKDQLRKAFEGPKAPSAD